MKVKLQAITILVIGQQDVSMSYATWERSAMLNGGHRLTSVAVL